MSDLVGNPEDRFSRVAAQLSLYYDQLLPISGPGREYKSIFMLNSAEHKI